jgi:hypothetical protein
MKMSRAGSRFISRLLIGCVLFAQLAVSSYACPAVGRSAFVPGDTALTAAARAATAADDGYAAAPAGGPSGFDQMDPDAANLCAEHCHQGQQSADTAAPPVVGLGIAALLYSLPLEPQRSLGSGRPLPVAGARLDGAPEPPHAILHCVFRI